MVVREVWKALNAGTTQNSRTDYNRDYMQTVACHELERFQSEIN